MQTQLYFIDGPWPGRLAIMPRPRGEDWLEDEVRSWQLRGVGAIVSLLTAEEVAELGLVEEKKLCAAHGLEFFSLPIPDRDVPPSRVEFSNLIEWASERLTQGKSVAVHCRQGIGRAAMVAIGILLKFHMDPADAMKKVGAARGCVVPETEEQRRWIAHFLAA